jgi:hypothetical protein
MSDISQTEIHVPELVIPELSPSETEIAIGKLRRYKSDIFQILVELIQAGGETLCSEIHKHIKSLLK